MKNRLVFAAAFVLGSTPIALLGAALFAAFGEAPSHWMTDAVRSDWLGFWGGVIGGVATLLAGVTAWMAVQQQIRAGAATRDEGERRAGQIILAYLDGVDVRARNVLDSIGTKTSELLPDGSFRIVDSDPVLVLGFWEQSLRSAMPANADDVSAILHSTNSWCWLPVRKVIAAQSALESVISDALPTSLQGLGRDTMKERRHNAVLAAPEKARRLGGAARQAREAIQKVYPGLSANHPPSDI